MSVRGNRLLAIVLLLPIGACDLTGGVVPKLPPGSGFVYDAFLLPNDRLISVGETTVKTYSIYDSQNNRYPTDFGPVAWTNETPDTLSLSPADASCADRCMAITGRAPGFGQVRASATYNGSHVAAAASFTVR
jgi:hypothetical protein